MEEKFEGKLRGRVVYIEPNDFRNQLGASFGSGDNVYWRPEDMGISVDLQVIIPDRNGNNYDLYESFNVNINSGKNKDNWTSFFRGEELDKDDPYLTDSFTDISYQEITQNRAGNKEALGIKSIDIQFDSHFYPVVKMRMIDLRGASLMMPAEENSEHSKDIKEERVKACQEFFEALFHFPYPRFALAIKGFYGSRVTFMLAVNDFQSSFNSQTGNFEVEVSFIGHMYGLYTDIPMSCLLVAPYIGGGSQNVKSDYWSSQIGENGAFRFKDGTIIPTFKEFAIAHDNISEEFSKIYKEEGDSYSSLMKIESLGDEYNALEDLYTTYIDIIEYIKDINSNNIADIFDDSSEGFKIYFLKSAADFVLPSIENFLKKYNAYTDIATYDNLVKKPNGFENQDDWGKKVPTLEPLVISHKNDNDEYTYEINTSHAYYDLIKDRSYIDGLKNSTFADKNVYLIKVDRDFINKISERKYKIDSEKTSVFNSSSEELIDLTTKLLGFTPTLENIVRMVFAHIDAFMYEYYKVINAINEHSTKRVRSNFGLSDEIKDDIDANLTDVYSFPPFTGFYQCEKETGKNVRKYPGSIPTLSDLEEVQFVNAIYQAIDDSDKEFEEAKKRIAEQKARENGRKDIWAPLSVLDALEDGNPYKKFKARKGIDTYASSLVKFIWKRFMAACLCRKDYSVNTNSFPTESEAENFWIEHGKGLIVNTTDVQQICDELETFTKETSKIYKLLGISEGANVKLSDLDIDIEEGHYILPSGNEDILSKLIANKNDISTEWDYKVDNSFLSNVYLKTDFKNGNDCTEIKDVNKNRKEKIDGAKNNNGSYAFPILQFYDSNYVPHDYFTNEPLVEDSEECANTNFCDGTFLASFLGTKNIYRFSNKESSIRTMPKVFALYIGERSLNGKNSTLLIDNKGYCNLNEFEQLPYLGSSLDGKDKNGGLSNYYSEWSSETNGANGFRKLSNACDDKKTLKFTTWHKDKFLGLSARKNSEVSIKNCVLSNSDAAKEYTNKMIDLVSSMVTVLNVKEVSQEGIKPCINLIVSFIQKILEKRNSVPRSDNVGPGASEGSTNTVSNATESGWARVEAKEQLYYTLKNLYDKWLSCYNMDRFKLNSPEVDSSVAYEKNCGNISSSERVSEVQNFMYVDTFYNNIGDKFLINPKNIIDLLLDRSSNRSVMQFIADMAQESKLLFVALPVFSNMYNSKNIESIFTPQWLYGKNEYDLQWDNSRGIGNTYVFMYTHQPSHFSRSSRNKNTTNYKWDELMLYSENEEDSPATLATLSDIEQQRGENYVVPAFGVTFSKQNQSYFKNINVNMSNPRETDVSIANRFLLAEKERHGDSVLAPRTVGQNLYSIYSNRSYECSIDMMGCANIMPLMYFQLNNVPLFRGAYMIYGVKHHIENGSMSTSFTGIRVSRNSIPINTNVIDVEALINELKRGESGLYEGSDGTGSSSSYHISYGGTASGGVIESVNGQIVRDNSLPTLDMVKAVKKLHEGFKTNKGFRLPYEHHNFHDQFGRCAAGVHAALVAGFGFETGGSNGYSFRNVVLNLQHDGKKAPFALIKKIEGAEAISKFNGPFEPGDVCCTKYLKKDGRDSDWGHVSIYDGEYFISDCVQDGDTCKNGGAGSRTYLYELYRYTGPIIYPSNWITVTFSVQDNLNVKIRKSQSWDSTDGTIITSGQQIVVRNPSLYGNKSCDLCFIASLEGGGNLFKLIADVRCKNPSFNNDISLNMCVHRNNISAEAEKSEIKIDLCNLTDVSITGDITVTLKKESANMFNNDYSVSPFWNG